jgi:Ca2+-transporting ATPase
MEDNKKMNDASMDGLTSEQVIESREKHGQNLLTPPRRTSLWKLYLEKYNDPIIRILLVAAVISLILAFIENEFIETIGIFLAIFIATTVGFCFEIDASKKFNVLTALGEEEHVKVRRGGKVIEIPRKDIVVGDIVMIETGDEIPADGQLLSASDLQIDESSLTGEPLCEKVRRCFQREVLKILIRSIDYIVPPW